MRAPTNVAVESMPVGGMTGGALYPIERHEDIIGSSLSIEQVPGVVNKEPSPPQKVTVSRKERFWGYGTSRSHMSPAPAYTVANEKYSAPLRSRGGGGGRQA